MLCYIHNIFKWSKKSRARSERSPRNQPLGRWLPRDHRVIQRWVAQKAREAEERKSDNGLDPSLLNLQKIVDDDPALSRLANAMFTEASARYTLDPKEQPAIQSFGQFLQVVNVIMQSGPEFYDKPGNDTAMGFVGFPINALLDWPMGTKSGYEFFRRREVNEALRDVLNTWAKFLGTAASKPCLRGWLSPLGQGMLADQANMKEDQYSFQQLFICPDPVEEEYLGFESWDAFFTRRFHEGVRPVEYPDDANGEDTNNTLVITNACESAPLRVVTDVKFRDDFQLKGQPYSLVDMLNNNPQAPKFVGGTVYQAFLSALTYHRWHAPVSGRVVGIEMVPGTYYSENKYEGMAANPDDPDPQAPNHSQPYISAVATRSIIYIQARNPKIGLMAIVFVGMAEVSSCEFTVGVDEEVVKGQEIGMFHFGGSSHCLVFRPGVRLRFVGRQPPWDLDFEGNNKVNSALAVVKP
ncbi:L-tryptophan decarboxylase [Colletotrichum spaethianum]|uniref:L-tryptophan decarboxylase n=1 Tax=Colletotrichum spaethianum TaxID=700344 RepID=A0AA37P1H1_9PEZI|nr:L-tryptophan decarboxylase [Colletotrichum spaethianum]GKT46760.1 L-tryptophan decarboxylase [Colletotrichum spaethianum]